MEEQRPLQTELDIMQALDYCDLNLPNLPNLQNVDMIIVFSGRGDFKGNLVDEKIKARRSESQVNTWDTIERVEYAVQVAKFCSMRKSSFVPIFFNGLDEQNAQLRRQLKEQKALYGYPSECFIVEGLIEKNTIGQCKGLEEFLKKHRHKFPTHPHFLLVSSTMHTLRLFRIFGKHSPQVDKGSVLERAIITVLGSDRVMLEKPGAEIDIHDEMCAVSRYTSEGKMARNISPNITSFFKRIASHSFYSQLSMPPRLWSEFFTCKNDWEPIRLMEKEEQLLLSFL